jgi:pyruvate/2-oxoacid:ferredoxin oxidoreductase beta subunit
MNVEAPTIMNNLPEQELMESGHIACAGCGATIAMRIALKALGPNTIMTIPACCWSVITALWPHSALKIPMYHTPFETAASSATGIRAALDVQSKTTTNVVAWAGDGGTFDIGIQALSGAAERNENIFYFCYDNEAYMNTGIQRSSATPYKTWTTTTPSPIGKLESKKDIVKIMVSHNIPYVATASVAFPNDFYTKVEKAKKISGTKFFHVFSPCPTGWKSEESLGIKIARLAVETKIFPLFEVINGNYSLTHNSKGLPVKEYLSLQRRFGHLTKEDFEQIQKNVDYEYNKLQKLSE